MLGSAVDRWAIPEVIRTTTMAPGTCFLSHKWFPTKESLPVLETLAMAMLGKDRD